MKNEQLRKLIRDCRLRHYEVAAALGVSEYTLSRWLRVELSEERAAQIRDAVWKVVSCGGGADAEKISG